MHPEKESKWLLRALVDYWEDYLDGWALSVTWERAEDRWRLRAVKGGVVVERTVSRSDWLEYHTGAVMEAAEAMYLERYGQEATGRLLAEATARLVAWAREHGEADTQGLLDSEWESLGAAAVGLPDPHTEEETA